MRRQRDHEGDVRDYAILVSDDGFEWRDVKRGAPGPTFDQQAIRFDRAASARVVRFVSLSGFGADRTTAIANLAVLYTGPARPDNSDLLEYKRVKSASGDIDEAVNADDKKKPAMTGRLRGKVAIGTGSTVYMPGSGTK